MKVLRRCGRFVRDLFMGHANKFWELGRVLTALFGVVMIVATGWNMGQGQTIDLGPGGLGGGLAALLTAGAVLIAAKDWQSRKAGEPADQGEASHVDP